MLEDFLGEHRPDFWLSDRYGGQKGFATRATFIIDKQGVVRWSVINGPGEVRSADDYAQALADVA